MAHGEFHRQADLPDRGAITAPSGPLIRRQGRPIGRCDRVLEQGESVRNAAHNKPVL